MARCFLCRCIVPVILIFHLVVGGGDGADADGGGGSGGHSCNCDFQTDMCCWNGLPLSTRAVWERPNGTVSHHASMTGQILKDHTYQNDTKFYVHVSSRNEIAILQSYALNMSTIYCLRFWYYIEVGTGKGNLHVILVNYTTGDIKGAEAQSAWTAPSRTPTNTYWIGAQVEIYYKDLFRIFFLASYVDYTAIDDITLMEAPCEVRPTEKPSVTLGTISVSKSSTSHVSPSISTNKPEASQINWNTEFLAVRPTEKPNLTVGTVSVSKSSASHVSPSISTNKPDASQRNGGTEFLTVRPTEKPSVTVGTISVSKSSASHVSPSISTKKPEASQINWNTDFLAVKRPPENLSSTEEPNLTLGTVSVSKSSTSHVSPSISTNKPEASQRNGITDVLAVRPREKPNVTVGTISVFKSSTSHVSPSISTKKPEASQRNGITDVVAVKRPPENLSSTEKPNLTLGTVSVSKSSTSHVSPSISTNKPEASQRNGITDVLAVRPREKPNVTVGTISVSKSRTSHVSPSISTKKPEASQRNGITDVVAVKRPPENLSSTEKPNLTLGTVSVSKSSTSHVSPSISTNKPEASQRNGITDVLAVRPTEKSNVTVGTISVSKSSTSHVSPSISTKKPEASQRNGITDAVAVKRPPENLSSTEKPNLTLGTVSVSKSSTSHVSPSISTNKPEASQRNGITDVLAVRPTEKSNVTVGTISVSKSSTSHVSPSISTKKPEASQRNGITDVLAEKPSVAISSGSFGSPFVSTPTLEASQRTGSTDLFAVANMIQTSNRTETTISITELNSTDGQLYVTSRKSVSFKTHNYTVSNTEIFYICIGVGCFLLLACCIGIFLFWKHQKRSRNRNDIEHTTPKSEPFSTSPYAAEPFKQNGDKHHGFSTTLYAIEQEIDVSHETGNGVQMLSESAIEIYQGKGFQGIQRDERVLTERTIRVDKMGSKSIFTKSKQSCNSSIAHGSKDKKMQIKVSETGLESNTGQTVLPSTSKGRKQTKPNSLTSFAVERKEINISNKRDEVSNTCTGRHDNENLLKSLNPPQNESSKNNVTHDYKASLGTQQRNSYGQPFNYMVVSADKTHDSSNSANKMRVKLTSDQIF